MGASKFPRKYVSPGGQVRYARSPEQARALRTRNFDAAAIAQPMRRGGAMGASASTSTVDGPLSEETTLLDLPPPIVREIGWLGRSGCLPEQISVLKWERLPYVYERDRIVFTVRQHDNLPLHAASEVEVANIRDEEFLRRDLKAELDGALLLPWWLPDGWLPYRSLEGWSGPPIENCSVLQFYELATACTRRLFQEMGYILMEQHEYFDREAHSATIRFTYCRTNMWTGRHRQDGKMARVFARNRLRGVSREIDAMLSAAARPGSVGPVR